MTSAVPANDFRIQYVGRTAVRPDGAVDVGFPGVTAHLRVSGDSLRFVVVASKGPQYVDVRVDQQPYRQMQLQAGTGEYSVALPPGGEHEVALLRCNESWQGTLEFKSFSSLGGGFAAPGSLPARKLMFVGDSVTCGELTAYHAGTAFNDSRNTDARLSYGEILARRFQAQCHLVSYGGRGMIRDWQGIRDTNNAPEFYKLALPDDPSTVWDPRRYVPDVIGVQLGTNDFSPGIPNEVEFVQAYVGFVRTLRKDAPDAFIFLMESPILKDRKREVLRTYLEEIVGQLRDSRIRLAPLAHRAGVPGNGHPTGAEHVAMADELEAQLKAVVGW